MANNQINTESRTFLDIRNELVNFIRQNYPDTYQDFNDASIGMMLIELLSAVSENLHFNIDRNYQETQIEHAQEKRSLMDMARTLGVKIPHKRPSITVLELSVTVPVKGDTFDPEYLPVILRGSQFIGGGNVFELRDDVDFASAFSSSGLSNRTITPNIDANGNIVSYNISKQEIALNGATRIFKYIVTAQDVFPFFDIILPDNDVVSIEDVIQLDGINYNRKPLITEWLDSSIRWYEVEALAQNNVFVDDVSVTTENGIRGAKWIDVSKRFVKEYTYNGFCKLIFGGGVSTNILPNTFSDVGSIQSELDILGNTFPLGEALKANSTLFIRYKVGGGSNTNVAAGTITNTGVVDILVNGSNAETNATVRNSLSVNNPIPALGGRDVLSIEEIRHLIKYNFAAQGRAVTIKDYYSEILKMNGRFGVPYKLGIAEVNNKISIAILGQDANGKLTNQSTNVLKQNIANFLSEKRMINDYVEVLDGRIINIALEIDVLIARSVNQNQLITEIKNDLTTRFLNTKLEMGQDIYLSDISQIIKNIGGVQNVNNVKVFNRVGQNIYSLNETSQRYLNDDTRQIDTSSDFIVYANWNEVLEIRFPEKDILLNIKSV